MSIEVAVHAVVELAGAPLWDPLSDTLLWVDVLGSAVHRHSPARGSDDVLDVPQHVGAALPRDRGGLVLNLRDGVALVDRDGSRTWLGYWARDGVRGGQAAVGPDGALWAGTTRYDGGPNGGWLARVRPNGDAGVVLDKVTAGSGFGWSPDGSRLYFTDVGEGRVDVLDFADGVATNRRPLASVTRGVPDGLCVDADGCVWVAARDGGAVLRFTPDGVLDREVDLPADRPTSCAFGGRDLTDLYVTTTRTDTWSEGSVLVVPGAGAGLPAAAFSG
ncbi:SMP-30/gluconolactonase/LRE family protein [Actinosynnema sp. NPDC020468]|uniref:SMP-30/gluconolactonase/LRE family protein n=1 Tax=Actinosynnema sp. NPDC020468 TaxID=3154488 RepID=UPI0033CA73D1